MRQFWRTRGRLKAGLRLGTSSAPRLSMKTNATLLPLLIASGLIGCGLEVSGQLEIDFDVVDEDMAYEGLVTADLREQSDYQANKDRIRGGQLLGMSVEILTVRPGNVASSGTGYAYAAPRGTPLVDRGAEGALARFDRAMIVEGAVIPLDMTQAELDQVTALFFPADGSDPVVDVLVRVNADGRPDFRARLVLDISFDAKVL